MPERRPLLRGRRPFPRGRRPFPRGTLLLLLLWVLLVVAGLLLWRPAVNTAPPELQGVLWPQPKPLQPFALTDHRREYFSTSRLRGKWTLLFFGYTSCPDICPGTLLTLKAVSSQLRGQPDWARDLQVVFVSVDPDRDLPDGLATYIAYFDREFVAVTGTTGEIERFSAQFAAGYYREPANSSGDYLIAHSSSIYLLDPRARLVAAFSPPHAPEAIVSQSMRIRGLF